MILPVLSQIARDERGTSVIELGVAAPILAAMLIGMVDVSRAISAKFELERAAQSATETVQQQGWEDTTAKKTALEGYATARAGTGSSATASSYLECWSGASKSTQAYDGTCSGGAATARYVKILVRKNFSFLWGVNWGTGSTSTYTMTAEASVRTQ